MVWALSLLSTHENVGVVAAALTGPIVYGYCNATSRTSGRLTKWMALHLGGGAVSLTGCFTTLGVLVGDKSYECSD